MIWTTNDGSLIVARIAYFSLNGIVARYSLNNINLNTKETLERKVECAANLNLCNSMQQQYNQQLHLLSCKSILSHELYLDSNIGGYILCS